MTARGGDRRGLGALGPPPTPRYRAPRVAAGGREFRECARGYPRRWHPRSGGLPPWCGARGGEVGGLPPCCGAYGGGFGGSHPGVRHMGRLWGSPVAARCGLGGSCHSVGPMGRFLGAPGVVLGAPTLVWGSWGRFWGLPLSCGARGDDSGGSRLVRGSWGRFWGLSLWCGPRGNNFWDPCLGEGLLLQ